MAPVIPTKRQTTSKSTRPENKSKTATTTARSTSLFSNRTNDAHDDPFPTSKADKRRIKHSAFISKISKPTSNKSSKSRKARRLSKKLVTTLESLADALPETAGKSEGDVEVGNVRIKQRSLKSRPGAMRRREVLERSERERFQRNLVQMTAGNRDQESAVAAGVGAVSGASGMEDEADKATGEGQGNTVGRWAALRNFINATMETKAPS